MAKAQPEELTVACDPKILAAIKLIGQGLMDLADALVAPSASDQPEPRPASAPQRASPPAEEISDQDDVTEDEEVEIKLADLQKMAKDLIKKGRRPKLIKILEAHKLENVSSAPAELWPVLKKELEEVGE